MSEQKVIEIEVLRYLPESDQAPHSEVYKVPFTDDMSVLQGAQYIKDNFDRDIDDPLLYHIVINTDLVGYEEAARLIGDAVIKRFDLAKPLKKASGSGIF